MRGHADGEGEPTERGFGDLEVDGEHVAAVDQVLGRLPDGDEGFDVDGEPFGVDAQDVAQRPHADLMPLMLGLEPGREVHPGLAIGAHRATLGAWLSSPTLDLSLNVSD